MLWTEIKFRKIAISMIIATSMNLGLTSWTEVVKPEEINFDQQEQTNRRQRGGLPSHRISLGLRGKCRAIVC